MQYTKLLLLLVGLTACIHDQAPKIIATSSELRQLPIDLCPLIQEDSKILRKSKDKIFKVLAIDGGGVRGIIPARILAELEARSGKKISELFDFMVGNSTGGLIVLALNIPGTNGKPKYKARDLVNLYNTKSKEIFKTSLSRKLFTGFGLWAPKYDRSSYDNILNDFFGNARMSELIKPTAVISYNLSRGLPHLWSRGYALQKPHRDFYVKDIAGATSAAPTYFAPKLLIDQDNNTEYQADGGIYANNPESTAISMAFELNNKLERKNIVLISIGTGRINLTLDTHKLKTAGIIGWVLGGNLIDVMMNAQSEWYDAEVRSEYHYSCRIQLILDKKINAMDNTSPNYLTSLLQTTEDYINLNSSNIQKIVDLLTKH